MTIALEISAAGEELPEAMYSAVMAAFNSDTPIGIMIGPQLLPVRIGSIETGYTIESGMYIRLKGRRKE